MKTEGSVRRKLQQVLFRHLKARLESNFRRCPGTCAFNRVVSSLNDEPFPRICTHTERLGAVCDDQHPGSINFRDCPLWSPAKSRDEVKAEFTEFIKQPRSVVAAEMPDAAALMWVLEIEQGVPEVDEPPQITTRDHVDLGADVPRIVAPFEPERKSWWRRLFSGTDSCGPGGPTDHDRSNLPPEGCVP